MCCIVESLNVKQLLCYRKLYRRGALAKRISNLLKNEDHSKINSSGHKN